MVDRYINAAKDGYLDVLKDATKKDLNTGDEDGMTAVIWAAHNNHLDGLRLIIGRGGDVDRCDYLGLTPLHHAAQKGLLPVATYLVNWGANVFALDNDHHSALDLASLHERVEVVQYLDSVVAQQQTKNPKHVTKLKEEALRQAERNAKRYEKLQEEAAKRAEKQQRKLTNTISQHSSSGEGEQPGTHRKQNLFQALTLAIRGTKSRKAMNASSGKSYSDIAGISHNTGARGGVAKRISQRRNTDFGGADVDQADFKISDVDESGKRTLRSISTAHGVRSKTSDVMYLTGQRGDGSGSAGEVSSSRPAVYDVFGGQRSVSKSKSESDLLDSGVDSYQGDEEEDEENAPGIFNRPGFGKTAFFTTNNFLNTLPSFDGQLDEVDNNDDHDHEINSTPAINGFPHHHVNGEGSGNDLLDDVLGEDSTWSGPKELPWDQDEVDQLDDDDETSTSSALEMFLWSAGLETYLHKFLQEKVDMEVLVKMSDSDLKVIGLPFGPRKKVLDAIKRRQDVLALPKHMTDSYL
ncbi:hypothetical protein V1264_011255 [Littorina saxatilis]